MAKGTTQIAITRFVKKMDRVAAFAGDEAFVALEEIGQAAVDHMRQTIRESGTPFSDRAEAEGLNRGPGRIRTGTMYEGIDYYDTSFGSGEIGASRLSIEFGYLDAPPSNQYPNVSYVQMQEEGFYNLFRWFSPLMKTRPDGSPFGLQKTPKPHMTEGTHALRDAQDYIRNYYRPVVARAAAKAIARRSRGA